MGPNLTQSSAPAVKSMGIVVADGHDVGIVVFVGVGVDVKLDRKFRKRLQVRETRIEGGAKFVLCAMLKNFFAVIFLYSEITERK